MTSSCCHLPNIDVSQNRNSFRQCVSPESICGWEQNSAKREVVPHFVNPASIKYGRHLNTDELEWSTGVCSTQHGFLYLDEVGGRSLDEIYRERSKHMKLKGQFCKLEWGVNVCEGLGEVFAVALRYFFFFGGGDKREIRATWLYNPLT